MDMDDFIARAWEAVDMFDAAGQKAVAQKIEQIIDDVNTDAANGHADALLHGQQRLDMACAIGRQLIGLADSLNEV